MPSVPYISAGSAVSANGMNALWATFDEKLRKLLSGKSWSYAKDNGSPIDTTGFAGKVFRFGFGDGHDYDQAPFDTFAAALTVTDYDETLRIAHVSVDTTTLDGSLAAHYRLHPSSITGLQTKYFYRRTEPQQFPNDPNTNRKPYRPERKHKLAVAEIYFGGTQNTFTLPDSWDKYNCFRLHNITSRTVTFDFGGHHSVAVKPYGQKAVRRDKVDGTYDSSRYYLFPSQAGDFRSFIFSSAQPVLTTQEANNCSNPCMIFPLIKALSSRQNNALFIHDNYENCVPKAAENFGAPGSSGTKLGDLMFHKGATAVVDASGNSSSLNFAGLSTMVADFALAGVTATFAGNVATIQKANCDLVCLGTNLIKNGIHSRGAVNINSPVTLDSSFAPARYYEAPQFSETESTVTFFALSTPFTGKLYLITGPPDIAFASNFVGVTLGIGDTVAAVTGTINGRSSGISTYSSVMAFTPFGPAVMWTETVSPAHAFNSANAASQSVIQNLLNNPMYQFIGGSFVRTGIKFFDGHGWPFYSMLPNEGPYYIVITNQQTNRLTAIYAGEPRMDSGIIGKHSIQAVIKEDVNADGADFEVVDGEADAQTYGYQQSLLDWIEAGRNVAFRSPDSLQIYSPNPATYLSNRSQLLDPYIGTEFGNPNFNIPIPHISAHHIRLRLNHDSYNLLAWAINRLKFGKCLTFQEITGITPLLSYAASQHLVWPRNAYAIWNAATDQRARQQAEAFGIPIKTVDDMPDYDYDSFGETVYKYPIRFPLSYQNVRWTVTNVQTSFSPYTTVDVWGSVFADIVQTYGGIGARVIDPKGFPQGGNTFGPNPSVSPAWRPGTGWITIEDVKAKAEEMGFDFSYFAVGTPVTVRTYRSDRFGIKFMAGSPLNETRRAVSNQDLGHDFADFYPWRYWRDYPASGPQPPESVLPPLPNEDQDFQVSEYYGFIRALKDDEFEFLADPTTNEFLNVDDQDVSLARIGTPLGTTAWITSILPSNTEDINWQHDLNRGGARTNGTNSGFDISGGLGFDTNIALGVVSISTQPQQGAIMLAPQDYNKGTKYYWDSPPATPTYNVAARLISAQYVCNHTTTDLRRPGHRVVNQADAVTLTPPAGYSMLYAGSAGFEEPDTGEEGCFAFYVRPVPLTPL